MKNQCLLILAVVGLCFVGTGCASSQGNRGPASRTGRPYKEPKAMNHRPLDTETLYQACLRERPELSCRNRMGR